MSRYTCAFRSRLGHHAPLHGAHTGSGGLWQVSSISTSQGGSIIANSIPYLCPFCSTTGIQLVTDQAPRRWYCQACTQYFRISLWTTSERPDRRNPILSIASGLGNFLLTLLLIAIFPLAIWLMSPWYGVPTDYTPRGVLQKFQIIQPPHAQPKPSTAQPELHPSQLDPHQLMLQYTNAQRTLAGVPPVRLGLNSAAQFHADASLANCYTGHWDRWGLKPNHRYTLAGGTGAEAENVHGLSFCNRSFGSKQTNYGNLEPAIKSAVQDWMDSPGHRKTLLDPRHTILNIGIAYDDFNEFFVQQFSSDYINYDTRPSLNDQGHIHMKGSVENATLTTAPFLTYQLTYDPPPQDLNRSQIARTYALCPPQTIAHINDNLLFTSSQPFTELHHGCTNPYFNNPQHPAPQGDKQLTQHGKRPETLT